MLTNKIKIDKDIDLLNLDKLYQELKAQKDRDIPIDLHIPIELNQNYLGITPNIIQFVSTWIRHPKSNRLIIDVNLSSYDKLRENVSRNEFLFPIIGLAWNGNGVYDIEGNNLRKFLKDPLNEVFEKMSKVQALIGDKLLLTNFDHLPKDKGILSCFEKNGEYITNEDELSSSLKNVLFNDLLRNYKRSLGLYKEIEDSLNGIIFELMKNTFEWAKSDEFDVPFDPNIRGLLIKIHKKPRRNLLDQYHKSDAISKYFENDLLKENTLGELYFLEISVFDSGAGFITKYKSLNNNDENLDDINIIKKCLIKRNTSARGINKSDKGIGLDRILKILDGRGWIRIKTENRCLLRNLISEPYIENKNNEIEKMQLFDWSNNDDKNFTRYEPAVGSVITIIYPLAINQ